MRVQYKWASITLVYVCISSSPMISPSIADSIEAKILAFFPLLPTIITLRTLQY